MAERKSGCGSSTKPTPGRTSVPVCGCTGWCGERAAEKGLEWVAQQFDATVGHAKRYDYPGFRCVGVEPVKVSPKLTAGYEHLASTLLARQDMGLCTGAKRSCGRFGWCDSLLNESLMFHGTPHEAAVDSILADGFDMSRVGRTSGNTGWYGKGLYVTPSAGAAIRYSYWKVALTGAPRRLLVCRVLLGRTFIVPDDSEAYVGRTCEAGYDSHKGRDQYDDDYQYAVFRSEQLLPAFILHFVPVGTLPRPDLIVEDEHPDKAATIAAIAQKQEPYKVATDDDTTLENLLQTVQTALRLQRKGLDQLYSRVVVGVLAVENALLHQRFRSKVTPTDKEVLFFYSPDDDDDDDEADIDSVIIRGFPKNRAVGSERPAAALQLMFPSSSSSTAPAETKGPHTKHVTRHLLVCRALTNAKVPGGRGGEVVFADPERLLPAFLVLVRATLQPAPTPPPIPKPTPAATSPKHNTPSETNSGAPFTADRAASRGVLC